MTGQHSWTRRLGLLLALAVVTAASAWLLCRGVGRSLPWEPEMDESALVLPAVRIVATGDLNPGWFGYPGSTIIYPLAALLRTYDALTAGAPWTKPDPALLVRLTSERREIFLLGRGLSIAYALATLPLLFLAGRRVAGVAPAVVACAALSLSPTWVDFAQQARTDAAAAFFATAALLLALRLAAAPLDRSPAPGYLALGAVVGLGLATRLFLAALGALPVLVAATRLRRAHPARAASAPPGQASGARPVTPARECAAVALALCVAVVVFFAATPYLLLGGADARASLFETVEKQGTHLGADGLSSPGNLAWYLSTGIPEALGLPWALLAGVGGVAALARWRPARGDAWLIVAHGVALLVALSAPGVHWTRWLLPVLPALALLGAVGAACVAHSAVALVGRGVARRSRVPAEGAGHARAEHAAGVGLLAPLLLLLGVAAAASAPPLAITWRESTLRANPPTTLLAREWIAANLPPGSKIAYEWYSAPLEDLPLVREKRYTLAEQSLDQWRGQGFEYLLTSSNMSFRYAREPTRYAAELAFYRDLQQRARQVRAFMPDATHGGPIVGLWDIREPRR